MREEGKLYQEIESYLNGNLTGEEKNAFEQRVIVDQELQKRVTLSRLANDLVIENRLLNVKQALHDAHTSSGGSGLWRKIVISTVGILLVSTVWFVFKNKVDNNTSVKDITKAETPSVITIPGKTIAPEEMTSSSRNNTGNNITNNVRQPIINSVVEERITTVDSLPNAEPISDKQPEVIKETSASPVQPAVVANPCQAMPIKAKVTMVNPCEGEDNGSITISGIKNGIAPYTIQINDQNGNTIYSYNKLKSGSYNATITDSKGCIQEISNINLLEKKCPKDYAFNPFVGDVWQIPVSESPGTLIIYDKSGYIYMQKEVVAGTQETWDGHSQQGELKTGYFIFTISYTNGTAINGSVTIVR